MAKSNMSNIYFFLRLQQNIFKPKISLSILLDWTAIEAGISCFYKSKGWLAQAHIFKNNNIIYNFTKHMHRNGVNWLGSSHHWIRTALRVWRDSWHPLTRNPRNISPQRILGNIFMQKTMGATSNDHICPIHDLQSDTKKSTKNIINIMRNKRGDAGCAVLAVFCIVLRYTALLLVGLNLRDLSQLETHWTNKHIQVLNEVIWLPKSTLSFIKFISSVVLSKYCIFAIVIGVSLNLKILLACIFQMDKYFDF